MNAFGSGKSSAHALVIQIESGAARNYAISIKNGHLDGRPELLGTWDPTPYLLEPSGRRLVEELARRIKAIVTTTPKTIACVGLTLPGTLRGSSIIDGSSRLGVFDELDVTTECAKLGTPSTYVFHDAECRALGEVLYDTPSSSGSLPVDTFAFLLVDEGVGASFVINGRPYRGAGVAGHIGRLVVEPSGAFNTTFASRGTLEVFSARPWVSHNVVNEYLSEKGKVGAPSATSSAFRAAVEAAAESGNTRGITCKQLANGAASGDPIATAVLQDAAQYLSFAVNAIITIMNPPLLILGGEMISEIPGFFQMIVSHARRNAWAGSWNETTIKTATRGVDAQISGAAYLLPRAARGEF